MQQSVVKTRQMRRKAYARPALVKDVTLSAITAESKTSDITP